jgi:hypothetical protein
LTTYFEPGNLVVELHFDVSTPLQDMDRLGGCVDFDVDSDEFTGRGTHCHEFELSPCPVMGVDYFIELIPFTQSAMLYFSSESLDQEIGIFPTVIDGTSVTVVLPRCEYAPDDGICLGAGYRAAAVIGNHMGPTDMMPNDALACVASPDKGDYDADGDVDQEDLDFLHACFSGASVPIGSPGCNVADWDDDGDVDQSDFGLLQAALTGAM